MSEPAVAADVAETTVQLWEEHFEVKIDADDRPRILRAIMAGRLTLDDKADELTYRLGHPVPLADGKSISEMQLREPNAGQVRDARKGNREDFDISIRLIGFITGCAVMDRVGMKDVKAMAAMLSFFD